MSATTDNPLANVHARRIHLIAGDLEEYAVAINAGTPGRTKAIAYALRDAADQLIFIASHLDQDQDPARPH